MGHRYRTLQGGCVPPPDAPFPPANVVIRALYFLANAEDIEAAVRCRRGGDEADASWWEVKKTAQELLDKLNAAKVDAKWRSDGKYVPKIVDNPKSLNHGACVLQCMDCEQDLSPNNIHDSVLSHSRRCTGDLRKRKADEAMDLTADSPEKRQKGSGAGTSGSAGGSNTNMSPVTRSMSRSQGIKQTQPFGASKAAAVPVPVAAAVAVVHVLVAGGLLPRARVARVKRAMMMQVMSQMMTPIPSHRQVQVHGSIGDETTS